MGALCSSVIVPREGWGGSPGRMCIWFCTRQPVQYQTKVLYPDPPPPGPVRPLAHYPAFLANLPVAAPMTLFLVTLDKGLSQANKGMPSAFFNNANHTQKTAWAVVVPQQILS